MLKTDTDPRIIHAQAIKETLNLQTPRDLLATFNHLITLYSNSNLHNYALRLFNSIPHPNTITWTSIISAFSSSHLSTTLFVSMLRHPSRTLPNARTLATLLKTCSMLPSFALGLQLHTISFKLSLCENAFVGSGLVSLYFKMRDSDSACKVFDGMSDRDEVCYGALINGLAKNNRPVEALWFFVDMMRNGISSTVYSVTGALCVISNSAVLEQSRVMHGHAVVTGLGSDRYVGTALVDCYGKCGVVEDGRKIFNEFVSDSMCLPLWNALMVGYAQRGCAEDVVRLFKTMEGQGLNPDERTFLAVLTAFCNASMVEETKIWFEKMSSCYDLEPKIEHYTCLVGALSRAGAMEKAESVVSTMPYKADAAIWRVLLSNCAGDNENADVAWRIAHKLLEIDPNDDSAYTILANKFTSAGEWDEVKKVRRLMREKGVRKEIGRSWVEVKGTIHIFFAGDGRHARKNEIYAKLQELMREIEKSGYVANWGDMWHDEVEERDKRELVWYHSEKLALAFGLLDGVTPLGKALRIVKNLRMCKDCHIAFKYVSVVVDREIIVRDAHRYHGFFNGRCTCGDSW